MSTPPPAAVTLTVEGVRVESESNRRDAHWAVRAKRARMQGDLVRLALSQIDRKPFAAAPRLRVTFQRIMGKRGRAFDSGDNLNGSFKFVRDVVARVFAVDDGDPWWDWKYDPEQVRGKEYGVRIRFEAVPAADAAGATREG